MMNKQIWRGVGMALIGALLVNGFVAGVAAASPKALLAPQALRLAANKILLVTNNTASAPFGEYLGEILRAEGLNTFDVMALPDVTEADLTAHAVTVLAETILTAPQAALFNAYVSGGGRLLAMKPDAQIKDVFNLGDAAGPLNDGYVRINPNATVNGFAAGIGFPSEALQIHGPTDRYVVNNPALATAIATLYSDNTAATPYPAVVLSSSGLGQAVAFLYDLGRNVAYTRQGNPANADKNIDNNFWNRPSEIYPAINVPDLFQSEGTSTTLWIDRDRMYIPQADVQQRLFARLVRYLASVQVPLPQFWYFPSSRKSMVVLTGDNDSAAPERFEQMMTVAEKYGGAFTFFMPIYSNGQLPIEYAQPFANRGHEFGPFPRAYYENPVTPEDDVRTLEEGFTKVRAWFDEPSVYGTLSSTVAVRTYDSAWKGWTGGAELAAINRFTMDFSYTNVGATRSISNNIVNISRWLQKPDGTWPHGYLTGSGQPMKFVKTDGTILPVYQQLTRLTDFQLLAIIDQFGYERLGQKEAFEVCKQAISSSIAKDYGVVTMQLQNIYFYPEVQAWFDQCLDYAYSNNLPIWNAGRWAAFTQVRHDAQFTNTTWSGTAPLYTLSFGVVATPTQGITLTVMVPLVHAGAGLTTVSVNGGPAVPYTVELVNGVNTAFINIASGSSNVVATYETDSLLTGLAAANSSPQVLYKPVIFTATLAGGSNPNFVWQFSDGSFSSGVTASHTFNAYPSGGTQVVTVTASNGAGSAVQTTQVKLLFPPQVYIPMLRK